MSPLRRSVCLLLAATVLGLPAAAHAAPSKVVWLCRPGQSPDPCTPSLTTTRVTPSGARLGVQHVTRAPRPRIDCFYVYPTVSDQPTVLANRHVDPQERSIALYQVARYSQLCRVYAPMYRQLTLTGIVRAGVSAASLATGYADVREAWRTYRQRYNHGRGVVLIGHSQGSFVLEELIAREIDDRPSVRRRLISALLMGGNVTVAAGRGVGGTFKHVPACRSALQLGCVVAFSTFDGPVPPNSLFGRTTIPGEQVLCTNPAALGGGAGLLDPLYPTAPFAPGSSLALGIVLAGVTLPGAPTPWVSVPGGYRAQCSSAGGANVLQITPLRGAPVIKPSPDATWGLHLEDANIALGNLIGVVARESAAYRARRG